MLLGLPVAVVVALLWLVGAMLAGTGVLVVYLRGWAWFGRWRGRRSGAFLVDVVGDAVEGRRRRAEGRGRMLALAGVLLLLGVVETAREMADTEPGGSVVLDLGYAVAEALSEMYIVAGGLR